VKYIPIADIKDPKQINLIDFKKHLYLSNNIDKIKEPVTPDNTNDAPMILASLDLNPKG
jgi:hypothetical protein